MNIILFCHHIIDNKRIATVCMSSSLLSFSSLLLFFLSFLSESKFVWRRLVCYMGMNLDKSKISIVFYTVIFTFIFSSFFLSFEKKKKKKERERKGRGREMRRNAGQRESTQCGVFPSTLGISTSQGTLDARKLNK